MNIPHSLSSDSPGEKGTDASWLNDLSLSQPHNKCSGNGILLRLIIYDIASPRRLRRIAHLCEDFGLRVQKSVFECWLDGHRFEELWMALVSEIDKKHDSLVAYTLDSTAAKGRRQTGNSTILTERRTRMIL